MEYLELNLDAEYGKYLNKLRKYNCKVLLSQYLL
jgi:hypothetical protein